MNDREHAKQVESLNAAGMVRWLHERSGLTWTQLGRAFGVSQRAVHGWANYGRMSPSNADTLKRLTAIVRDMQPCTPEEARDALLSSWIDQFRSEHSSGSGDISGATHPPDYYLGAIHGDVSQ
ncbi:helix-turn-helix domain-containing protein [Nocardia sp. NPDC056611]|uniref:helix-turn-helix domain-containing protein n=1 Tax=Nocardia sp. NPDC056611 TaxID=3345877 RepID=UPI003672BAB7